MNFVRTANVLEHVHKSDVFQTIVKKCLILDSSLEVKTKKNRAKIASTYAFFERLTLKVFFWILAALA